MYLTKTKIALVGACLVIFLSGCEEESKNSTAEKPTYEEPTHNVWAEDNNSKTRENVAIEILLKASSDSNDTNPLLFQIINPPRHGTLDTQFLPRILYTPNNDFFGNDSFMFKAIKGNIHSNVATVSIHIIPNNRKPVAQSLSLTTDEDTQKTITLTGIDPDGDKLTFEVVSNPSHGTLTGVAPNLTYIPERDYSGTDSFKFNAKDSSNLESVEAIVSITVNPVNDIPVGDNQSVTTPEDTIKNITLTGSDPEGTLVTYVISQAPSHGTLSGTAPNIQYRPNQDFNGSDSFTFKVKDQALFSEPAAVYITITPVNDKPSSQNLNVSTDEDIALSVSPVIDRDGDTLTYQFISLPQHGTLTGNGPLTYTPDPNYFGTDQFSVRAKDPSNETSDIATTTLTIHSINDTPSANNFTLTTTEDTAKNITLSGSDKEPGTLTFQISDPPTKGKLTGTSPNLTYTPNANINGTDSFTYVAKDSSGATSQKATVTITITPVNDAPIGRNMAVTLNEDEPINFVLDITDPDGDTLTFTRTSQPTAHGTLTGTPPNLTYTPTLNFNGSDSVTYKGVDPSGKSASTTVSFTIRPINDPPIAQNQTVTTTEDTIKPITLVGTDIDSPTLTYEITTQPLYGTLSTGTGPGRTYTPRLNYNGPDSFRFKVKDSANAQSNIATVSITVNAVNDAPIANSQNITLNEDIPTAITLTGSDADNDTITFQLVSAPTKGTLTGTIPNLTYTPKKDYYGQDSFIFTVTDSHNVKSQGSPITLTINGIADITQIDNGDEFTCALIENGFPKCWGNNNFGQLGLGDTLSRGNRQGQMGNNLPYVNLGAKAKAITTGATHTCALLTTNQVKCWGSNSSGELGLGDTATRGDATNEMGTSLPAVNLGTSRTVKNISAGEMFTCAILDNNQIKCWGNNSSGQLGLGDTSNRGDGPNEMGNFLASVNLGVGRSAKVIATGSTHACAILDNNQIKCWGRNSIGQLGLGDTGNRGDGPNEMGDNLPTLNLGTGRTAKSISLGRDFSCVQLDNDQIKCFGFNSTGQLGLEDTLTRGSLLSDMGDLLPFLNLGTGRTIKSLTSGNAHTCALLDNNQVKCWGYNPSGALGQGDVSDRGDESNEMGDTLLQLNLGTNRLVKSLSCGKDRSCAILDNNRVKCWGDNESGALGLMDDFDRANEPNEMGDNLPFIDLGNGI